MFMSTIKLFETSQVRSEWDSKREVWSFSIVDVVAVLTDSADAATYWRKLKQRLKAEGNETVANCHGLKMQAEATTTEISREKQPEGLEQNRVIAKEGGTIAGNTVKKLKQKLENR